MGQGDNFVANSISTPPRLLSGIFILVAIVISNAYKNTNVHRMVLPRAPVPYETLDQLVADGFTIHTRITKIDIGIAFRLKTDLKSVEFVESLNEILIQNQEKYELNGTSEISELMERTNNASILWRVFKKSSIHSGIRRIYGDLLLHSQVLFENFGASNTLSDIHEILRNEFFDNQKSLIYEFMESCERIAVLLPNYLCNEVGAKLAEDTDSRSIHIGTETYSFTSESFTWEGLIPNMLHHRLAGAAQAGLWDWVDEIIESRFKFGNNKIPEPKSGMSRTGIQGNALVIFVMYLSGVALATITFTGEAWRKILFVFEQIFISLFCFIKYTFQLVGLIVFDQKVRRFKGKIMVQL